MSVAPHKGAFFTMRIVTVDHYMSKPAEDFDLGYSVFSGAGIDRVPVIRVFGATPAGQKCCLHLHQVFHPQINNNNKQNPLSHTHIRLCSS